jgi:hypothetical protein
MFPTWTQKIFLGVRANDGFEHQLAPTDVFELEFAVGHLIIFYNFIFTPPLSF